MRGTKLLLAAFVVATGAFWGIMLTSPPESNAVPSGVDIRALTIDATPVMGQPADAF